MKLALTILLLAISIAAQPMPKVAREFRAVWIATVDNIDFPTQKGLSAERQKAELISSLELAKRLRLNAVIFQVRPMTDSIYRSSLEPWSEFLTGEMGKPQDFDPLEFLVTEAHRRGILVHAWFNPYRAYHPAAKTMSPAHVSKTKSSMVRQYGRYMWLDPTSREGQKHSVDVIADVVRRYDIDGVHFDDYFYPYAENDGAGKKIDFPDHMNWETYQRSGGKLGRDDWRRENVNTFIAEVGRTIKRIKPRMVYGISPFGIWQPMPDKGITGFNAYAELYADAKKWLQDGTVDYLTPQLYWETARKGQSFPVLLDWWKEQNTMRRFVWPGIAAYRIGSTATFTTGEIDSQIQRTRLATETTALSSSVSNLYARTWAGSSESYAIRPTRPTPSYRSSPGSSRQSPRRQRLRSRAMPSSFVQRGPSGSVKAFWFVVYAKDKDGWSQSILPASERSITLSADRKISEIVVTSVDRLGNESPRR